MFKLKNMNNININLKFNHRITLQRVVQNVDNFGDTITTYEDISSVWSIIKPTNIEQNFSRLKSDVETTHLITIKYFKEAQKCKRIIYNSRIFSVLTAICPNEENKFIIFSTKEIEEY